MQNQSQDSGHQWQWPHAPAEAPQDAAPESAAPASGTDPLRQRVQEEAYRIAEERGFPENAQLEHWLEAERLVKQAGSDSERH